MRQSTITPPPNTERIGRVSEVAPVSRLRVVEPLRDALSPVERTFIENWGAFAECFGMARDLGRVHALLFIAREPIDDETIQAHLALNWQQAITTVEELVDWGVVQRIPGQGYVTERDPWAWFMNIMRERHRREFLPVLQRMLDVRAAARELAKQSPAAADLTLRIERFTDFVDGVSNLMDLFVRLGSRPMTAVLRTMVRLAPRA